MVTDLPVQVIRTSNAMQNSGAGPYSQSQNRFKIQIVCPYKITSTMKAKFESVSKSFQTGCLELELQMVQLSATRCSWNTILWASLVSFTAIALCVASQVFIVISLSTQFRNFWIHPGMSATKSCTITVIWKVENWFWIPLQPHLKQTCISWCRSHPFLPCVHKLITTNI
jgi:hypothetical protein